MSNSLSDEVRSVEYPSSLPLALESEPVQKSVEPYVSHLSSIVEQSNDVRGVVFTINDELIGGDVYASNVMFMRLWPRLLKAAAIEAVTELPMKLDTEGVTIEAIRSFLVHSEQGAETIEEITARTHVVKREIENSLFFETRDMDNAGAWIHRSYLTKKQ